MGDVEDPAACSGTDVGAGVGESDADDTGTEGPMGGMEGRLWARHRASTSSSSMYPSTTLLA